MNPRIMKNEVISYIKPFYEMQCGLLRLYLHSYSIFEVHLQ